LDFETPSKCKSVVKALIPDNVNFPKGLSVKMSSRKSTLYLRVVGQSLPAKTIISTVDEILEHAAVCKKVMFD
jgi:hypothetical protein